jgi:hypothetical protein
LSVSQSIVNSDLKSDLNQFTNTFPESVKLAIQRKTVDLAEYNQIVFIINKSFVDLSTFGTLGLLINILKPQIIILKSF